MIIIFSVNIGDRRIKAVVVVIVVVVIVGLVVSRFIMIWNISINTIGRIGPMFVLVCIQMDGTCGVMFFFPWVKGSGGSPLPAVSSALMVCPLLAMVNLEIKFSTRGGV